MPEQHWGATARQVGTGDMLWEVAPTKEDLDLKLFGRAYGAESGTVVYYRYTPEQSKGDSQ